jgi:hypothetical protein
MHWSTTNGLKTATVFLPYARAAGSPWLPNAATGGSITGRTAAGKPAITGGNPKPDGIASGKSHFPADWQEFVHVAADGERHIADVKTGHGLVLEFQHSHLRPDERAAREAFYPNLIWVVDGTRLKRDTPRFAAGVQMLRPTPWRGIYTVAFPGECFPPNWLDCRAPAFFDFAGAEPVAPDATPVERHLWGLLPGRAEGHGVVVALDRRGLVRAAHERPQILDAAQIVGVLQARFRAARVAAMQQARWLPSGKRWKRRRVWRRPRPRRRF